LRARHTAYPAFFVAHSTDRATSGRAATEADVRRSSARLADLRCCMPFCKASQFYCRASIGLRGPRGYDDRDRDEEGGDGPAVERSGSGASLVDVLDRVLDKGIVIDAWVRVSVVGIDLLSVEARIVVASIDTYLRYADAVGSMTVRRGGPSDVHPLVGENAEL